MNVRTLLDKLNYDQYNVHTVALNITEEIEQAEQLIYNRDSVTDVTDELKDLCRQVAIYYLFYKRDFNSASHYLDIYRFAVPENSQQQAEALIFLGHAMTIDGGYKNDVFFRQGLDIFANLDKTPEVQLGQAFAFRYIALMHHRKNESDKAQENIKTAIKIQESFLDSKPEVKIALAESYHILGVILLRQGKDDEALQALYKAKELEDQFCAATKVDHFMKFTTMQSIASVWMRQDKLQDALDLLDEAYQGQVTCFKTKIHADIAKTLHFKADVYMKMGKYDEALNFYIEAYNMKMALNLDEDIIQPSVIGENNARIAIYHRDFNFDWNDYRTIQASENLLEYLTRFIDETLPIQEKLSAESKEKLGQLCYRVGTYYLHVYSSKDRAHASDQALKYLLPAKDLLKTDEEQAWAENHLAFCYQQKIVCAKQAKKPEDIAKYHALGEKAYSTVISDFNPDPDSEREHKELFAFALCVKALTEYEMGNIDDAIRSYKLAIYIYEQIEKQDRLAGNPLKPNDQKVRAQLRLAMMQGEKPDTQKDAEENFRKVLAYWEANQDPKNPYAARAYVTYANYLRKAYPLNIQASIDNYEQAYKFACSASGEHSEFATNVKNMLDKAIEQKNTMEPRRSSNFTPRLLPAPRELSKAEIEEKAQRIIEKDKRRRCCSLV